MFMQKAVDLFARKLIHRPSCARSGAIGGGGPMPSWNIELQNKRPGISKLVRVHVLRSWTLGMTDAPCQYGLLRTLTEESTTAMKKSPSTPRCVIQCGAGK